MPSRTAFFENMNDYYQEIKTEIDTYLQNKNYEEALFVIKKELEMPYIPSEFETYLIQTKKDIIFLLNENKKDSEESLETLLNQMLHGKPQVQLMAVSKLINHNLRSCVNEIKEYFSKQPLPEAVLLLIDALAEQEIQEEFTVKKNGIEYTFYGDSITPVSKSEGFLKANEELNKLYDKNPSMLQIARKVLVNKAYQYLPLSYEIEEVDQLLEEVQKEVNELFQ